MESSLRRNVPGEMRLYVLCLDESAYECLQALRLPGVVPVRLETLERDCPDLRAAKGSRTKVEYYFTCTPVWVKYLLNQCPEAEVLTYVDADLFFYSSVEPIFDEMQGQSVLVIPHRFPPRLAHLVKFGQYNVAFQVFRRDANAFICLDSWRRSCLESCAENGEAGQFGDQRYLDDWPANFKGVHVLRHVGADVAPWNVEQYKFTQNHRQVLVDGIPLIFYHFQGYRQFSPALIDPGLLCHGWECPSSLVVFVHVPYVRAMQAARLKIANSSLGANMGKGETRGYAADDAISGASHLYKLRFVMEGHAMLCVCGGVFYSNARWLRKLFKVADSIRSS